MNSFLTHRGSMRRYPTCHAAVLTVMSLLATVGWSAAPASSPLFLDQPRGGSITIETAHPHIASANLSPFSGAYFLTARVPIVEGALFVVDIPFANVSLKESGYSPYRYWGYSQGGSSFGSIYVGLEFFERDGGTFGGIGARLPTTQAKSYDAVAIGQLADLDRFGSFSNCYSSFSFPVGYRQRHGPNFETVVMMTPALYSASGTCGGGTELCLQYGASVGAVTDILTLRTGVTGFLVASADEGDFGELTFHHLGLNVNYNGARWRPGIGLKVRLDEFPYPTGPDYTLGLNLVYAIAG